MEGFVLVRADEARQSGGLHVSLSPSELVKEDLDVATVTALGAEAREVSGAGALSEPVKKFMDIAMGPEAQLKKLSDYKTVSKV